jgi:hypothetical protein
MTVWEAFLSALGFASGAGWNEEAAVARPFWLRWATWRFVDGEFPSTADVLVEVTALDAVHQAAASWLRDARRR